jgi:DNA-binding NarL/FixJ family response regulator
MAMISAEPGDGSAGDLSPASPLDERTKQERQILELVAGGLSYREIA